jgi:hypothetical protein
MLKSKSVKYSTGYITPEEDQAATIWFGYLSLNHADKAPG